MKIQKSIGAAVLFLAGAAFSTGVQARDQLQIVGSSTVFPFSTAVAERFGQKSSFPTPVVESTGSGGGMKLFCAGVGEATPDITNASRRIKDKEVVLCADNGVTPVEVKIGFDGIVVANANEAPTLSLTRDQLFLALAKNIVVDGAVVANPNVTWADVDPSLPNVAIEVLGPPPTSGTRDAFVEIVMEKACQEGIEEDLCGDLREDGAWIDAGENDNLMVQKLATNDKAVGVFGFSFLSQNANIIKGATIDGIAPTFEAIASGDYPISRSLYFYIKKEHVGLVPGVAEFAAEFTAESTWGDEGYLADIDLIPLPAADRAKYAEDAKMLNALVK